MKARLPFTMTLLLGTGLVLGAAAANAQEPRPGAAAPPPPAMDADMARGKDQRGPHGRFSPADRAAFFDAHLAGLHAGLQLSPEQEKLWPPVEAALRAGAKGAADRMEAARNGQRPANAIAWLRKLSADDIAKGETLKALADAAQPLYESLSDEQKRRLPFLLHGIRPHRFLAMGPRPSADDEDGRDEP